MPKKTLRTDLLARRRAIDHTLWQHGSRAAQLRLISLEAFQRAACIALYSPIQQEVDTELLFATARSAGKQVLYPLVCDSSLQFREVTETGQRTPGAFGILEPCRFGEEHSLTSANLIVVPGVAFDLQGHRIGFGKGYYDRCLSQLPKHGTLVGLCHDFQLLEQVPAEGHDIRMQYVVTDKRIVQVVTGTMPD